MEVLIRKCEPSDYLDIREIHSFPSVYSNTLQVPLPSEELWKKRLGNPSENMHLYVAEVEDKVVGFSGVTVENKPRRKHVASIGLTVHEHWQNKGVGTQLLLEVISIAENWLAITRVELTVFVDNHTAIKLYQKMGFEKEGIHKNYAFRNGQYQDVVSMARVNTL